MLSSPTSLGVARLYTSAWIHGYEGGELLELWRTVNGDKVSAEQKSPPRAPGGNDGSHLSGTTPGVSAFWNVS